MSVLRRVLVPNAIYRYAYPVARAQVRLIHPSTVALKKKQATSSSLTDADDVFVFDTSPDEELFASTATSSSSSGPAQPSSDDSNQLQSPGGKTEELLRIRAETFKTVHTSTLKRFTQPRRLRQPPKKSIITRLVALADTKEQLGETVDLMAVLRSAGMSQEMDPSEFIRRCISLKCPELALKVLSDRPKYGVDLSSLRLAHHLMNELSNQAKLKNNIEQGIRDSFELAELYALYGLPPPSTDVFTCTVLAGAMARDVLNTPKSNEEDGDRVTVTLVSKDSFDAIMTELKMAVVNWNGVDEMRPRRTAHWMRDHLRDVVRAVRREGSTLPLWLGRFWKLAQERPQKLVNN